MALNMSKKIGLVTEIKKSYEDFQEILVSIEGTIGRAINYPAISGMVNINDEVVLNTTAVEMSLGTGGNHFVICNLNSMESSLESKGHIMKMRYAPQQIKCMSVEEQDSPYHEAIKNFKSLDGLKVVVGTLHSMLPAFLATLKYKSNDLKTAFVMTDGAALPIQLSNSVRELKEKKLLDETITTGHSFGGDFESVNFYTGIIAAKEVVKADVVIVAMGPGIVGTGTKYGFSGVEQGYILDGVNSIGGKAIAIPRISFGDKRERHQGLSHHARTILGEISKTKVHIPINIQDEDNLSLVKRQIIESKLDLKHDIHYIDSDYTKEALDKYGLKVKTMGRSYEEDSEFFKAAGGAAIAINNKQI